MDLSRFQLSLNFQLNSELWTLTFVLCPVSTVLSFLTPV